MCIFYLSPKRLISTFCTCVHYKCNSFSNKSTEKWKCISMFISLAIRLRPADWSGIVVIQYSGFDSKIGSTKLFSKWNSWPIDVRIRDFLKLVYRRIVCCAPSANHNCVSRMNFVLLWAELKLMNSSKFQMTRECVSCYASPSEAGPCNIFNLQKQPTTDNYDEMMLMTNNQAHNSRGPDWWRSGDAPSSKIQNWKRWTQKTGNKIPINYTSAAPQRMTEWNTKRLLKRTSNRKMIAGAAVIMCLMQSNGPGQLLCSAIQKNILLINLWINFHLFFDVVVVDECSELQEEEEGEEERKKCDMQLRVARGWDRETERFHAQIKIDRKMHEMVT